jgi:hypothetical protein
LHRHAQLVGGPGDASFLGHDPKVIQVLVVEGGAHGSFFERMNEALSDLTEVTSVVKSESMALASCSWQ